MRKSVLLIAVAAVVSLAAWPSTALAQQGPLGGKVFVSVNFGIQVGDNSLERTSTFDLYEETATVDISQTINNGAFFDFSGAYKFRDNLGFGMAYDFVSNSGDGTVSGSLPHPELFDQPRTFTASADDLAHSENAFHFMAVWFVPFTDKVDFTISGRPLGFQRQAGADPRRHVQRDSPKFHERHHRLGRGRRAPRFGVGLQHRRRYDLRPHPQYRRGRAHPI